MIRPRRAGAVVASSVAVLAGVDAAVAGPSNPGDPFEVLAVSGESYVFTEVTEAGGPEVCREIVTIPLDDVEALAATVNLSRNCALPQVSGTASATTGIVATGSSGSMLVAANGAGSAFCSDGGFAFSRHDVSAWLDLRPEAAGIVRLRWTVEAFGLGGATFRLRSDDGSDDVEASVVSDIDPVIESGTIDLPVSPAVDWSLQLVTTHQASDYSDPDSEFTIGFASIVLSFETIATAPAADLDGNGRVDAADVGLLLAAWGPCRGCPEDLDGTGVVDAADLGRLLADWGS